MPEQSFGRSCSPMLCADAIIDTHVFIYGAMNVWAYLTTQALRTLHTWNAENDTSQSSTK